MSNAFIEKNTKDALTDEGVSIGRVLVTPDGKYQKYLITLSERGGYFVERVLIPGHMTVPVAYRLTSAGLNGEDIPVDVWNKREEFADDQRQAYQVLSDTGIDPEAPLEDFRGHSERNVRQAVATLNSIGYILLWPEDAVEKLIRDYVTQWERMAIADGK